MNISELKPRIYGYLGFKGAVASPQTDALIAECLTELDEQNEFRVTYKIFTERPAFLNKPPYESFLKGASAVVIEVASLGATHARALFSKRAPTNGKPVSARRELTAFVPVTAEAKFTI